MRVITPWAVIGSFDSSRALLTFSRCAAKTSGGIQHQGGVGQGAPLSTRILRAAVRPRCWWRTAWFRRSRRG